MMRNRIDVIWNRGHLSKPHPFAKGLNEHGGAISRRFGASGRLYGQVLPL
jgi:hypothetical protein